MSLPAFMLLSSFLTLPLLAYWLRKEIEVLRSAGRRFNYRITDAFAAVLLLSPATAMFMSALLDFLGPMREPMAGEASVIGLVLVVHQVLAMALGRIDIQLPPYDGAEPSAWRSAGSIFVFWVYGSLMALLFLVFPFIMILRMSARFGAIERILRERKKAAYREAHPRRKAESADSDFVRKE